MSELHIAGIRHHSPACSRLVARLIQTLQPGLVLIEGPSDFNHRLDEMTLAHTPPIAIYSYSHSDGAIAQCWYPFLDYSPEWVALRTARQAGIAVQFIDLPHWHYRTRTTLTAGYTAEQGADARYRRVQQKLQKHYYCDGDDSLWDSLFEAAPADVLLQRLTEYFTLLRGEAAGGAEDQAREAFMAAHITVQLQQHSRPVLVVCGGWHQAALQRRVAQLLAQPQHIAPPEMPELPPESDAGSYLVPYEFRQVDSLAGYGAGMQSPQFYQWCWEHGSEKALALALENVVQRLRKAKIALSSADFIALQSAMQGLARLRGHLPAQRADLLDAVMMAVPKQALEQPAPWTRREPLDSADDPVLREALLALTGERMGRLDSATPQPPLLKEVEALLERHALVPQSVARELRLDRRRAEDNPRAEILWRLKLLGISGVELQKVVNPAQQARLPQDLFYEEQWRLHKTARWYPDLIEASRFGPTLAQAVQSALLQGLQGQRDDAAAVAQALIDAVRAGLAQLGQSLSASLHTLIPALHDPGTLAQAGLRLLDMVRTGFWGQEVAVLFARPLQLLAQRLLWLLEGRQDATAETVKADVAAVAFLSGVYQCDAVSVDRPFILAVLRRTAVRSDAPVALRGAAVGCLYALGQSDAQEIIAGLRRIPLRDGLGDFLYGLFSRARALMVADATLAGVLQEALEMLDDADFLVVLPALRGAFSWFPPRERGDIARRVAEVLGLSHAETLKLNHLPQGGGSLLNAKNIEAQALAWAAAFGLIGGEPSS